MKTIKKLAGSQIMLPLIALLVLVLFNLIWDPSFFAVSLGVNNAGNPILKGNLIDWHYTAECKISKNYVNLHK